MCTISSSPNMTINSHGEIPAEKKPRAKPHYLKAMVTFNSPKDCKNPVISESPYYNIMVSTYNLPHIFLTNISRNWFCKTNPTTSVFRAGRLPIQLFPESTKSQSTEFSWHLVSATQRQSCSSNIPQLLLLSS